jgi:hypothetical protein
MGSVARSFHEAAVRLKTDDYMTNMIYTFSLVLCLSVMYINFFQVRLASSFP